MLRARLKECFRSEEEFFGRSLTRRWQRLNYLFVSQGTNVEMMTSSTFNRWMTGKTNTPRITSEQRSVFDAILTASEGRIAAAIGAAREIEYRLGDADEQEDLNEERTEGNSEALSGSEREEN